MTAETSKKGRIKKSDIHLEMPSQMDLFLGDLMAPATKNDRASMEHPFFSIQKGGDKKVRIYEDARSGARIEIHPSTAGSSTIWDKDILIYLGTLLRKAVDGGQEATSTFTFTAQDLLRAIGRSSGGKDYKELEKALDRLVGTRVKTNIATGDEIQKENFSMLGAYKLLESKTGRLDRVRITLSDWFFRAITEKEILSIPPAYFELTGGLERRIYELVRKHCGKQPSFSIGLDRLYLKSGSTSPERRFRFELRKLVASDKPTKLLDYWLVLDEKNLNAFADSAEGRKACGDFLIEQMKADGKVFPKPRLPG